MLTVYGRASSLNVQKVMWLVGELGLTHRHVPAGGRVSRLDTPGFLAMNPNGRVPVIEEDGVVVWESHAILRYLAARHGGGRFWSDDAADRSQADRWMDWAQSSLLPEVLGVFWAFYRTPPDKRDQTVINRALAGAARHFGLLDRILANRPFLLGEDLSLADIPAGASLYRWFTLDIQRPDLPHVAAWYERLQARPAYRQHVMVPYDELRGHQDY